MDDTNNVTKTTTDMPDLARSGFTALPEGCGQLVDTSGPPRLLKRAVVLVKLAAGAMLGLYMPALAAATLLIALLLDFMRLLRFRRRDPCGPMDQQVMLGYWRQHAVTLLRLRDPAAQERVLAAVCMAADGQNTRLVMAGVPQLISKRSPRLSGTFPKDEASPWHLFLLTDHRSGADYEHFCQAAGLVSGSNNWMVEKRFAVGFCPPSQLVYLLLPLVFDVVGVGVRLWDISLGRVPRTSFEFMPCQHKELAPLVQFSEKSIQDPNSAAQAFIMLNLMKPSKDESMQSEDNRYVVKQLLMFCSALRIRPFMVHMGGIQKLSAQDDDPWFEQVVCMFHPSAAWLNRMLQSTLFNSGAQKKLEDMETILIMPLDITGPMVSSRRSNPSSGKED
mmetsp:Transcript_51929/g.58885  ORF Transcript_51929/g.58885 Transcript_51929/m.58885 type:complete len:391 (+) Transcript_51929:318-1490(+)